METEMLATSLQVTVKAKGYPFRPKWSSHQTACLAQDYSQKGPTIRLKRPTRLPMLRLRQELKQKLPSNRRMHMASMVQATLLMVPNLRK